ncbi:chitin synthase-domain-containing protein [Catenaria anguillulae PL171]|uniref:chitin synthase n=1 Tax=Catenaria anguillulae PL171 TaxID=765915 RepID=A0A1Y2HBR4_9FUNG|nr:chitin synthase-domain-containing protein [Catenaria anguillulae PL171]
MASGATDLCALVGNTSDPSARQISTALTGHAAKSRDPCVFVGPRVALITTDLPSNVPETVDPIALLNSAQSAQSNGIVSAPDSSPACTIAAKAWFAMQREKSNQVINIHSLALSTHNQLHHLVLEQLIRQSATTPGSNTRLHTDVIKAHLLLDTLTCVATAQGNLSVRCGKLTEMQYDGKGTLIGAKICDYHMDANRAGHASSSTDSNFLALHALVLAAASNPDLKRTKLIGDQAKYQVLCQGAWAASKHVSDATFQLMSKCMNALGLKKRFQRHFFDVLAGLLTLGNVEFVTDAKEKAAATVRNMDVLLQAADLLGVSDARLKEVLTCKSVTMGDSTYTDFLSPVQAMEARATFISSVYGTLVSYVIDLANQRLNNESQLVHSIAVIDMGGIEASDANAAHQLCRNYATDRVHTFCLERFAEHLQEAGATTDGATVARVLAREQNKTGPTALLQQVFDILESETRARANPNGGVTSPVSPTSPQSFSSVGVLDKLHSTFGQHPSYSLPPGDSASGFAVRHSLGPVTYALALSMKQMSGVLPPEVITICRAEGNDNPVLARAFSEQRIVTYSNPKRAKTIVGGRAAALRRKPTMKPGATRRGRANTLKSAATSPVVNSDPGADGNNEPKEDGSSTLDEDAEVPLSRLSNNVFGQHRLICDKLLNSLATCGAWEVILAPLSTFNEEAIRHSSLPAIVSGFAEFPYALILPVNEVAQCFPAVTAGANPLDIVSLADAMKAKCSAVQQVTVSPSNHLILRDTEWFALEAVEYSAKHPDLSLIEAKNTKATFAKVRERAQRPQPDDEDKQSMAESSVTQDELELGALSPLEKDLDKAKTDHTAKPKAPPKPKPKLTPIRRRWLCCTTLLTWWIPECCLIRSGMVRADVRQTWREKVALCLCIALCSALMLFFITGFSRLMCPEINMYTVDEVLQEQTIGTSKWTRFYMHGGIYDFTNWNHPTGGGFQQSEFLKLRGRDISAYFPRWNSVTGEAPLSCTRTTRTRRRAMAIDVNAARVEQEQQQSDSAASTLSKRSTTTGIDMPSNLCLPSAAARNGTGYCHSFADFRFKVAIKEIKGVAEVAKIAWNLPAVATYAQEDKIMVVISGKVYDATGLMGATSPLTNDEKALLSANKGKDITSFAKPYLRINCLDDIAFVGIIDTRNYLMCNISNYILYGMTGLVVGTMVIKFLCALQLGSKRVPEDMKKYVLMQVPCYSEGTDSLRKTINSLALTDYDDTRKLLFIIADGLIKGSGNEKPTPDLVLDIFGVPESHRNVQGFSYHAIGEGSKGHNKAKVYSGLYHIQGRAVPYVVVIKCGTEQETTKAGNRGKRDSQMVLMKWMNKILLNLPMTPLELEMYRHVRNIIGVPPASYEYVLMVDADTEVGPDCLTRLVSACVNDSKIMGLCGETRIANEKTSWVTMIQVYEYYISHMLAKAFESLFGSVTCLPGCFSMYRMFSVRGEKKTPLLVDSKIIQDYSECIVDTLHKKNLLHLGEDRYLTTLMLKTFPEYKMKFTPDSYCMTIVPDQFSVLLSQRRRWINSTIHNLFELTMVEDLCGCLIFSMRLIVILDLFATLVMPASVAYLFYLLYCVSLDVQAYTLVLYLIAATYGMQATVFLIRRKWEHIGWMLVHILAMPVFYMYIPLYSYWHFDDFSWGATRRIEGDSGKGGHDADEDTFDPASIPTAKWEDYKRVKKAEASLEVAKSVRNPADLPEKSGSKSNLHKSQSMDSLRVGRVGAGESQPALNASAANLLGGGMSKNASMASLTDIYRTSVYGPNAATGAGTPRAPLFSPLMSAGFGYSPSMGNLFLPATGGASPAIPGSNVSPDDPSAHITDAMIMDQVRAIVLTQDLTQLTKKKVRTLLGEHFGVSLASRRETINACVDAVLMEVCPQ